MFLIILKIIYNKENKFLKKNVLYLFWEVSCCRFNLRPDFFKGNMSEKYQLSAATANLKYTGEYRYFGTVFYLELALFVRFNSYLCISTVINNRLEPFVPSDPLKLKLFSSSSQLQWACMSAEITQFICC